jgi:hypothetical protein
VTLDDATLVLNWERTNSFVPPLVEVRFDLKNATIESAQTPDQLDGKTSILIARTDPNRPVRGTISGKATTGSQSRTVEAYVYIPAESTVPKKRIIPIKDEVYLSVAYWGNGSNHQDFPAPPPPADKDRIIVTEAAVRLGKHPGKYVPGSPFCDGFHEYCIDNVITNGCLINKEWHDWYKNNAVVYKKEEVCEG